jgi:DNA-binding IclR family transcriptional regulator
MPALKTRSVPSLERGITILELIAGSRNGLAPGDLARQMGLPRSSVHCLLLTLERCGYLHRNERTNRYLLGAKIFQLANMALGGLEVRERAAPLLQQLARDTGLTVHLAILEQNEAVLIDKVEPLGRQKLATWLGKRMDVHCTSLGKALIAFLPEEEVERVIEERGLPRHNDNTIVSPRRLREELARVRANGFATDDEEDEIGARCIGAPVFDSSGGIAAAVSLSGTVAQITEANSADLAARVCETAGALSETLGHKHGSTPRPE